MTYEGQVLLGGAAKKQEQATGIMGALYGTPWSFEVRNGQS